MASNGRRHLLSILDFVCNLAMKHKIPTTVTFDQPLYWKATEIIIDAPQNSYLKGIILLLGCFHTLYELAGYYWNTPFPPSPLRSRPLKSLNPARGPGGAL